jgi:hypothetical protein
MIVLKLVPHITIKINNTIFSNIPTVMANFGLNEKYIDLKGEFKRLWKESESEKEKSVLEIINCFSKIKIKDKAGDFIGSRMGRPEKAKLRKLTGSPNTLFPVGSEGGRLRSFQAAVEVGEVSGDFPLFFLLLCFGFLVSPRARNKKLGIRNTT